jgi:bifunctional N-acetylglucosamine-1-phosphate-uridyltransferase/glucosamine-1-phosphate-acetyltransferase GlmU-like protein
MWPQLFAQLPAPFAAAFDRAAPWRLLDRLDEELASLPSSRLESPLSPEVHLLGDRIVLGPGARILPGAVLEGPLRIGRNVEIRPGAYLRGGCWIGDDCVIGANVELKHALLLDRAHVPHLNYVGDSVLGAGVNLGAGSVLSNFRHDGGEIQIAAPDGGKMATGRRKFGAVLGDGVLTGCNSVLHPGCIVGRQARIYPGVQLRSGVYAERCLIKLRQALDIVNLDL